MRKLLAIPLAFALAACGADEAQPEANADPTEEVAREFDATRALPAGVGSQWVYEADAVRATTETGVSARDDVTFRLDAMNGDVADIVVFRGDAEVDTQAWRIDSERGVFQTASSGGELEPPMPLLPLDKVDAEDPTFAWSGNGPRIDGTFGPMELEGRVEGLQRADTTDGRVDALAVTTTTRWQTDEGPAVVRQTTWWAEEIGIVRLHRELNAPNATNIQTLRLKSRALMKEDNE